MTDPIYIIEKLSKQGYDVTISRCAAGRNRMPLRKEDIERGRGMLWYCAIKEKDAYATDFVTGYGNDLLDAIADACKQGDIHA